VLDVSPELRVHVDEVLACDERVIAVGYTFAGRAADGGEFQNAYGAVIRVESGQMTSLDRFEPDDQTAILTRYAELSDERPWALFDRLFNARALDALPVLYTDEY